MEAEANAQIGAERYERSEDRTAQRNYYRDNRRACGRVAKWPTTGTAVPNETAGTAVPQGGCDMYGFGHLWDLVVAESGIDELCHGFRKGIAELQEETGVDAMRHDLRRGMSSLKEESGIDEGRRELSSLDRPPG